MKTPAWSGAPAEDELMLTAKVYTSAPAAVIPDARGGEIQRARRIQM
jgi:hypothetical protein